VRILIETKRLQMREFTLDDVDAVYEFSTCSDVTQFTGDWGVVKNKNDAEKLIRTVWLAEYRKYGYARYALIHKGDRKVIGFCGIKFEPELGLPDIGYRMMPEYWGKGLGTEAVRAALKYAREVLGLQKIVGEVVDQNTASNKLLLKVGFRLVDSYEKDGFTINRYE
jgi:ribosomal-protein-alanine N-acetyltransferase